MRDIRGEFDQHGDVTIKYRHGEVVEPKLEWRQRNVHSPSIYADHVTGRVYGQVLPEDKDGLFHAFTMGFGILSSTWLTSQAARKAVEQAVQSALKEKTT